MTPPASQPSVGPGRYRRVRVHHGLGNHIVKHFTRHLIEKGLGESPILSAVARGVHESVFGARYKKVWEEGRPLNPNKPSTNRQSNPKINIQPLVNAQNNTTVAVNKVNSNLTNINKSINKVNSNLTLIKNQLNGMRSTLSQGFTNTTKSINNLSTKINSVSTSNKQINQKLSNINSKLGTIYTRQGLMTKTLSSILTSTKSLATAIKSVEKAVMKVDSNLHGSPPYLKTIVELTKIQNDLLRDLIKLLRSGGKGNNSSQEPSSTKKTRNYKRKSTTNNDNVTEKETYRQGTGVSVYNPNKGDLTPYNPNYIDVDWAEVHSIGENKQKSIGSRTHNQLTLVLDELVELNEEQNTKLQKIVDFDQEQEDSNERLEIANARAGDKLLPTPESNQQAVKPDGKKHGIWDMAKGALGTLFEGGISGLIESAIAGLVEILPEILAVVGGLVAAGLAYKFKDKIAELIGNFIKNAVSQFFNVDLRNFITNPLGIPDKIRNNPNYNMTPGAVAAAEAGIDPSQQYVDPDHRPSLLDNKPPIDTSQSAFQAMRDRFAARTTNSVTTPSGNQSLVPSASSNLPPGTLGPMLPNSLSPTGGTSSQSYLNGKIAAMRANPTVMRQITDAAQAQGVDPGYMLAVAASESNFNPAARNPGPGQSATGLFQMITQTASHYGLEGADRVDAGRSSVAMASMAKDEAAVLKKNGFEASPSNMYMIHFMGSGGGIKFLKAMRDNPNQDASSLFPDSAKANRSAFYDSKTGKPNTLAEVYNVMSAHVNNGSAAALAQAAGIVPPQKPVASKDFANDNNQQGRDTSSNLAKRNAPSSITTPSPMGTFEESSDDSSEGLSMIPAERTTPIQLGDVVNQLSQQNTALTQGITTQQGISGNKSPTIISANSNPTTNIVGSSGPRNTEPTWLQIQRNHQARMFAIAS